MTPTAFGAPTTYEDHALMYPHPTRGIARSTRAMIASPHALATQIGLEVLRRGGNAIDAAIAANAVLAVVYPASCGIGGDALWIVHEPKTGATVAYNGGGAAPQSATLEQVAHHGEMPIRDALAVTVPGAVRSWYDVHAKHGSIDMAELLAPAEGYARDGFAVSDVAARYFELNAELLLADDDARALFLSRGTPRAGSIARNEPLAESFAAIRRDGPHAFYDGAIGESIVATLNAHGSTMTLDDLAAHRTDVMEPLRLAWRGLELIAHPPNSQGATTLMALGAIAADAFAGEPAWTHHAIEAIKRAFHRRDALFGDPRFVDTRVEDFLTPDGLRSMRASIDERALHERSPLGDGDTIALVVVDEDGRCVSLIQSLYMNFGSGIMAAGTGIFLHNRGAYFNTVPGHPNCFGGGKRPVHTLSPAMVFQDGKPKLVHGTMGADGQPQTQMQLIHNIFERGMSVQQALDAPRWLHGRINVAEKLDSVRVESRMDPALIADLERRGHEVKPIGAFESLMGHAHAILIDEELGTLAGGADPRADSAALGL